MRACRAPPGRSAPPVDRRRLPARPGPHRQRPGRVNAAEEGLDVPARHLGEVRPPLEGTHLAPAPTARSSEAQRPPTGPASSTFAPGNVRQADDQCGVCGIRPSRRAASRKGRSREATAAAPGGGALGAGDDDALGPADEVVVGQRPLAVWKSRPGSSVIVCIRPFGSVSCTRSPGRSVPAGLRHRKRRRGRRRWNSSRVPRVPSGFGGLPLGTVSTDSGDGEGPRRRAARVPTCGCSGWTSGCPGRGCSAWRSSPGCGRPPSAPAPPTMMASVVFALLLYVSILAHELGHGLLARWFGNRCRASRCGCSADRLRASPAECLARRPHLGGRSGRDAWRSPGCCSWRSSRSDRCCRPKVTLVMDALGVDEHAARGAESAARPAAGRRRGGARSPGD